MSDNLEFHYVVSYREGYGWHFATDVEQAVMTDGTIFDWNDGTWTFPSGITTGQELEVIDLEHYKTLSDALSMMNGEPYR